jgi:hypothetical protein
MIQIPRKGVNNIGEKMNTKALINVEFEIEYKGIQIDIIQVPYCDLKIFGFDRQLGYFAQGIDKDGNNYEVYWPFKDHYTDDEMDEVDWDVYYVRDLGFLN